VTGAHSTSGEAGARPATPLRETARLAAYFTEQKWAALLMVVLGLGAALAETLGIGLAVMLLFALLDQSAQIMEGGGLLARLYGAIQSVFGASASLIAVVFFMLILFNALLIYAYQLMAATMLNLVAERLRDMVHRQYVTVGYRFLQQREHGELIHTLATETWTVSGAFFSIARIVVNMCAVLVFGLGIFALSWVVGLTALVCAVAVFALLRLLARPVRRLGQETLEANQILAERMLVSLTGMRTLRVFAQESYVLRVFGSASSRVRRLAVRTERIKALIGPLGELGSISTLIIIALVAKAAGVDVPTIVAAVLLLFRLQPHLQEIETHRMALAEMQASLRNVREMLDRSDKPWPTEGTLTFPGLVREVRFENVNFFHDPRRGPSLGDASFTIRRGETTALSGPSGSGKTTVMNLLLRLYEPDSGRILVDGTDLNDFTRASWLSRLAIAGQDVELIEGTVEQNIRLAAHDATIEEIRAVCEMVEILDDIECLPDGFDARIGAGGLNFSGGQRQRIGLARALLRDPEFLILDEAMSAIEPAREDRIRRRIAEMMRGRTILVVSHRSTPSIDADHTVFVENGRAREAARA